VDQQTLERIVAEVVQRVTQSPSQSPVLAASGGRPGVFQDLDTAVRAATAAQRELIAMTMADRERIIQAMRDCALGQLESLSRDAVEETGLGRVDDKIVKNRLVATKTPGTEILTPWVRTGDNGLVLQEYAPFGVIAAITPCTNPTETILCNGISFIAAGNSAVFNVHPAAKKLSARFIADLNLAIMGAGGPNNLLACIEEPTIKSANELMTHKGTRLVVVTGGGAVVKAAMSSGKRAIAAGPGNPPCVVDETADLEAAGKGIVDGCSLDNNVVCIAEKEVLVVASVADGLRESMCRNGAYLIAGDELRKLEALLITPDNHVNRDFIGKDAAFIADAIGLRIAQSTRLLLCEVEENHPFVQHELLMPVLGMVRYANVDAAIDGALRCEHGYGHTASMWSRNLDNLHQMARVINTSIFIKNAPNYAGLAEGGEGYTSFTIASPTGEGLTTAVSFSRIRRCTLKDRFRIV
jgi:acyl-CoA reductase-like NAD-dependent aldehyde dehydrogenase